MRIKEYLDYIRQEKRKKQRKKKAVYNAPILMIIIAGLLLWIVNVDLFGYSPTVASNYLLNYNFFEFSASKLFIILEENNSEVWLYPILLTIYWAYHIALLVGILAISFPVFDRLRDKKEDYNYRNELIKIIDLIQLIKQKKVQENNKWHKDFEKKANDLNLDDLINPIKTNWYENPARHWFKSSYLPNDVRRISISVNKFSDLLVEASQKRLDLRRLLKPLNIIKYYFMSVASKNDPQLDEIKKYQESDLQNILNEFSDTASKLTLQVKKYSKKEESKLFGNIKEYIQTIVASDLVKSALTLSLIAALVMMIGVLLFDIDSNQAFLAWFTVSFGSLTISVGVTSFKYSKKDQKE